VAEESSEDCIRKLASISVYWHCKNLFRIYHPEMQRSVFLRVPLPNGEIDYRFAVAAMHAAGYGGYMAIEGAAMGDQFHADQKSLVYAKTLWADLGRPRRARRSNGST
jgi:sugar phosphate isomerase/epimerase